MPGNFSEGLHILIEENTGKLSKEHPVRFHGLLSGRREENVKGTEILGDDEEGELCIELQVRRHLDFSYVVQMHLFFMLLENPSPTGV